MGSGPWSDHHTSSIRLPPMRSAFALAMRLAGRIIGAPETIEATRLWERWTAQTNAVVGGWRARRWSSLDSEALCVRELAQNHTVARCNTAEVGSLERRRRLAMQLRKQARRNV